MREFLHGAHDLGDALNAFQRLIDSSRNFGLQIYEIRCLPKRIELSQTSSRTAPLPASARTCRIADRSGAIEVHDSFEEVGVVPDVLRRSVDLVGDARGQLSDGLQFLGLAQLDFQALPFRDVGADDQQLRPLFSPGN